MADLIERLRAALADSHRVDRELGRGGTATVFLAQDLRHHRPVAIKVLDPALAAIIGPERFEREIEIAGRLQHPHILTLLASGREAGMLYYIMPYVEGESLRQRLDREHQLPVADALRLAGEVADALEVAHRHGVIHRDIKPENILLSGGHAMVADFGIARAVQTSAGKATTPLGSILGTPLYMSPEQALGDPRVDARSDIYSLGCVLYEMLAGQPPFTGSSAESLVHQHMSLEPRPVTALRPAVPAPVDEVLSRSLAKTPADRFPTAGEFAAALATARTPAVPTVVVTRRGLHPWVRKALVALLTLLVLAGVADVIRRVSTGKDASARSLVVLPFTNLTGDPGVDYLCAGIPAEILGDLVRAKPLNVVSQTTAWSFRGSGKGAKQIAKELGAGSVVEGALQRRGPNLKLDVRLVDGRSGYVVWSGAFDRALDELLPLAGEISDQVAATLLGRSRPAEAATERGALPTRSAEAYEQYLQAGRLLDDPDDPQAAARAAALYSGAIALDPDFALAHAGLSKALWKAYARTREAATFARADEAAKRATQLNPQLLEARLARAQMYRGAGRYAEAVAELNGILDINPNWDEAQIHLGATYRDSGDLVRAEASFRRAAALRPGYWRNWNSLGALLVRKGEYSGARAAFEQVVKLAPDAERGHEQLASLGMLEGRYDQAIAAYRKFSRPMDATLAANLGTACFFARRLEEAEAHYLTAVKLEPKQPSWHQYLGDLYQRRGKRDLARDEYRAALRLAEEDLALRPEDRRLRLQRVLLLAKSGQCEQAGRDLASLQPALPANDAQAAHSVARLQALCGRSSEALAALRSAIALGFSPAMVRDEDEFRSLASDPEFQRLTALAPGGR